MIKITENSLRDGHQSLLATRMRTDDMVAAAEIFEKIGFHSVEVWGGATYDTCLRFLKEDPFDRLRKFKEIFKNTPMQMLLRGQNLVGYRHYADDVVREFIRLSAEGGVDIFRIFDALNDVRNLKTSIEEVKKQGKHAQGAISYTVSPIHTLDNFITLAKEFVAMGCDSVCIKDMAGLLTPYHAYELVTALKNEIDVPLQLHSHSTAGFAFATHLKAVEAGVDVIDCANSALADGTSHPCTQAMVYALQGTKHDTGLDLEKMERAAEILKEKRRKYKKFESEYNNIDTRVLVNQIPGGMISNLANQLRDQNALDKMDAVLDEIPKVREDFGYPPLVTPSSQIVGTQAVLNVLSCERYKTITTESKNYIKGLYGKPPTQIAQVLRDKVLEGREPEFVRPADLLEPEMERAHKECEMFCQSPTDVISYVVFGQVARQFMEERNSNRLNPEPLYIDEIDETSTLPNQFSVTVHGERHEIKIEGTGQKSENLRPFFIRVDGELREVFVEAKAHVGEGEAKQPAATKPGELPKASGDTCVSPPMPGKITNIKVQVGDKVKKGDTVAIVEAMKMENEVQTPKDGEIKEVYATVGMQVGTDECLMIVN